MITSARGAEQENRFYGNTLATPGSSRSGNPEGRACTKLEGQTSWRSTAAAKQRKHTDQKAVAPPSGALTQHPQAPGWNTPSVAQHQTGDHVHVQTPEMIIDADQLERG